MATPATAKQSDPRNPRERILFQPLLRYSIRDSAALLGISRALLYQRIRAGTVKTIHDGGRVFVPGTEIARLSASPGTA